MNKAQLIADIAARVRRVIATVQEPDPVKAEAGITVYRTEAMDVVNGNLEGRTIIWYVLDEGQASEEAYYKRPPSSSTDFVAIADRAVEIIGSADSAQAQTAFDAMSAETVTAESNWETELSVISRMGMAEGVTVLETLKAAGQSTFGTDVIKRFIESARGVNLADAQTIGFVSQLVSAGAITQAQADSLLSTNAVPKWGGLTLGQVTDALTMRAAGEI